jgi:uncharacterized membrane protein YhaH (DUF805 family)
MFLFDTDGRISRARYLAHMLGTFLVALVVTVIVIISGGISGLNNDTDIWSLVIGLLAMVWLGWVAIYLIALSRRMRDCNINPAYAFVALIGPLFFIFGIAFAVMPGTNGPNRYGPEPGPGG